MESRLSSRHLRVPRSSGRLTDEQCNDAHRRAVERKLLIVRSVPYENGAKRNQHLAYSYAIELRLGVSMLIDGLLPDSFTLPSET